MFYCSICNYECLIQDCIIFEEIIMCYDCSMEGIN